MNIAINGFGRIGRVIFKAAIASGLNIVAINDLSSIENIAYLLKYDSVYGKFDGEIKVSKDCLIINEKKIKFLSEKVPEKLPWKKMEVDVVVESTGRFTDKKDASKHLKAGAKKVVITAPAKNPDITVVPGVNVENIKSEHNIISVASCTTNCLAPIVKVLNDKFGVVQGLMTTVHAYTNGQTIQDAIHKKFRRGRAGAYNMVPTTTGAATAVAEVIPELKGKLNGLAIRVPVICGSIVDFTAVLKKPFTEAQVNAAVKEASENELKGIVEYSEDELVSSDIVGNKASAVFDSLSTQKQDGMVKVLIWYDNEFGYSNRVIDVLKKVKF